MSSVGVAGCSTRARARGSGGTFTGAGARGDSSAATDAAVAGSGAGGADVWAAIRERYLTRYRTASNRNRVDGVTSATLRDHQNHHVTWNLKNVSGSVVPDGDYKVVIETTDRDATGQTTSIAFTKGPAPVELTPPDQTYYVDMKLSYE